MGHWSNKEVCCHVLGKKQDKETPIPSKGYRSSRPNERSFISSYSCRKHKTRKSYYGPMSSGIRKYILVLFTSIFWFLWNIWNPPQYPLLFSIPKRWKKTCSCQEYYTEGALPQHLHFEKGSKHVQCCKSSSKSLLTSLVYAWAYCGKWGIWNEHRLLPLHSSEKEASTGFFYALHGGIFSVPPITGNGGDLVGIW